MMRTGKFGVITVILVLAITFCCVGTAMSQSVDKEQENYYRHLEKEYVSQVRNYLNEEGYQNPGVSVTRVVDANGSREYTLTLHHKKFDRMSEAQKTQLCKCLEQFQFEVEDGGFCQEFLETNF